MLQENYQHAAGLKVGAQPKKCGIISNFARQKVKFRTKTTLFRLGGKQYNLLGFETK